MQQIKSNFVRLRRQSQLFFYRNPSHHYSQHTNWISFLLSQKNGHVKQIWQSNILLLLAASNLPSDWVTETQNGLSASNAKHEKMKTFDDVLEKIKENVKLLEIYCRSQKIGCPEMVGRPNFVMVSQVKHSQMAKSTMRNEFSFATRICKNKSPKSSHGNICSRGIVYWHRWMMLGTWSFFLYFHLVFADGLSAFFGIYSLFTTEVIDVLSTCVYLWFDDFAFAPHCLFASASIFHYFTLLYNFSLCRIHLTFYFIRNFNSPIELAGKNYASDPEQRSCITEYSPSLNRALSPRRGYKHWNFRRYEWTTTNRTHSRRECLRTSVVQW